MSEISDSKTVVGYTDELHFHTQATVANACLKPFPLEPSQHYLPRKTSKGRCRKPLLRKLHNIPEGDTRTPRWGRYFTMMDAMPTLSFTDIIPLRISSPPNYCRHFSVEIDTLILNTHTVPEAGFQTSTLILQHQKLQRMVLMWARWTDNGTDYRTLQPTDTYAVTWFVHKATLLTSGKIIVCLCTVTFSNTAHPYLTSHPQVSFGAAGDIAIRNTATKPHTIIDNRMASWPGGREVV